MVSIGAFQALDPGSIPGRRNFFYLFLFLKKRNKVHRRFLFQGTLSTLQQIYPQFVAS